MPTHAKSTTARRLIAASLAHVPRRDGIAAVVLGRQPRGFERGARIRFPDRAGVPRRELDAADRAAWRGALQYRRQRVRQAGQIRWLPRRERRHLAAVAFDE